MDKRERHPAADTIIRIMLTLPPSERTDVTDAIRHNGVFCIFCGYGSIEVPNADCQCWNDE